MQQKSVTTDILDIAYLDYGAPDGWPCIMGHGFPYDVNAYAEAAPLIAQAGARVLVPYLRGYGPTRFRSAATLRSGEQAALGADLLAFMDVLGIQRAVVGGYDWGGRAACVVSVLHPERVVGLVSGNSYNIQNIARSMEPASPPEEAALWYQYLFHNERGRRAVERNGRGVVRQVCWMWSPSWQLVVGSFFKSAVAFDNPDFVDVVIHSYRHRYALVEGDPAYAAIEAKLAAQPPVLVPTIANDGDSDGVNPGTAHHARKFEGFFERRVFAGAGHNLPQERPADWAQAVLDVRSAAAKA